jgi:hypothetical protein
MTITFPTKSIRLLVFLLVTGSVICLAQPNPWGFSEEEIARASKLGLNLLREVPNSRYRSVGEQTWLCPWVVEGSVERIDGDLYGPYHTKVRVRIARYFKGEGPTAITINLHSGRLYSQHQKGIVIADVLSEIKFPTADVGKTFILFLNKRHLQLRGRPEQSTRYAHGEGEFNLLNRYLLEDGFAKVDPELIAEGFPGKHSIRYGEIVSEILRIARAQQVEEAKDR